MSDRTNSDSDVEQIWRDFWAPLVVRADGTLDLQQVKKELADFRVVMSCVSRVYEAVTGGKVSKILTDPDVVIALADDRVRALVDAEIAERDSN